MNYWKNRKNLLNLAGNILSETDNPNYLPNQVPSKLFTLRNGIKIGVIGLITKETLL